MFLICNLAAAVALWTPFAQAESSALPTPAARQEIEEVVNRIKTRTLSQAPDLLTAMATRDLRNWEKDTAWARWLPRLDLQLSSSRAKDYSFVTSGDLGLFANQFQPAETTLDRWALNLNFPLYRRSLHLGVALASAQSGLAEIQFELKSTEIDWRLRGLLGNYLLQLYQEATLGNSITLAENHLREAKLRFELGQKTRIDVLRAEANLARLEASRLSFEEDLKAAMSLLSEFSGLNKAELNAAGIGTVATTEADLMKAIGEFALGADASNALATFLELSPQGNISTQVQLVEKSPIYRSYLSEDEISTTRARARMDQEWPELTLQGTTGKQAQSFSTAFSAGQQSYSVGAVLSIPIFSGGSTYFTYQEKLRANRIGEIRKVSEIKKLFDDVANQRNQIRSRIQSLVALKLSLAENEEIVRLSFKSYQLGKSTIVELLGSQNDLIDSKIAVARSVLDLATLERQFAWNLGVQLK